MSRSLTLLFLLVLSAPSLAGPSCPGQLCFAAKVVRISDGDTVTLLRQDGARATQIKARLTEIDAPEHQQPWGARSRQALANKVFGQTVLVASSGKDRYGRLLARLHLGRRDINREMVREGHAWVYRRYATENWLPDEAFARNAGQGLWSLGANRAVPPWQWRRGERQAASGARLRTVSRNTADFSCGSKRYCREMTSCDEALFHLQTCGLTSMDGDQDGVPCEGRLCRG